MKKLIAISVVFALVAGVAFAADLSASVFGHVNLFDGATKGGDAQITGGMDRLRIQGSAEVMDGKFGAQLRIDPAGLNKEALEKYAGGADNFYDLFNTGFQGFAWWKPIDQFKLIIGQSGADDGFWGKDGASGWGFNQMAYDCGVAVPVHMWGPNYSGLGYGGATWYDGLNSMGVFMEIKPLDILSINIGIPASWTKWDADYFKTLHFQVDLNLAFGEIALSYGAESLYLYYGGSFGAIGIDVGLAVPGITKAGDLTHINFGADVKFSAGAFGIKVRTAEGIPVKGGYPFYFNLGLLPYFAINDNFTFFLNAELGMATKIDNLGWLINPYIRIGAEWGPTFYAGFQISQEQKSGAIKYALPIGMTVGF